MLGTAIKFLLPFAFLTYGHPAMAQAIVKGRVIDDGGEPIMGAHIQWKDTKVAATSDIDGYFIIIRASLSCLFLATKPRRQWCKKEKNR